MGITVMENFDLNDPSALAGRGFEIPTYSALTRTIVSDTENGVTRPAMQVSNLNTAAGSMAAIKIPIPTSKVFYMSMRIKATALQTDCFIVLNNTLTTSGVEYCFADLGVQDVGHRSGPRYKVATLNNWFCMEVYRAANGAIKVWVNDFIASPVGATMAAPGENFLYLSSLMNGGAKPPATFLIDDLVVVDPATPGLQYRCGSAARLLTLQAQADVTAEWTPAAGVTTPHYQIIRDYPSTISDDTVLTSDGEDSREQYQYGAPSSVFGNKILGVSFENLVRNPGGVTAKLSVEADVGAGRVEVGSVTVAGSPNFAYRPVIADKKPDGSSWSMADLANLKAGYSLQQ